MNLNLKDTQKSTYCSKSDKSSRCCCSRSKNVYEKRKKRFTLDMQYLCIIFGFHLDKYNC